MSKIIINNDLTNTTIVNKNELYTITKILKDDILSGLRLIANNNSTICHIDNLIQLNFTNGRYFTEGISSSNWSGFSTHEHIKKLLNELTENQHNTYITHYITILYFIKDLLKWGFRINKALYNIELNASVVDEAECKYFYNLVLKTTHKAVENNSYTMEWRITYTTEDVNLRLFNNNETYWGGDHSWHVLEYDTEDIKKTLREEFGEALNPDLTEEELNKIFI